MLYGICSILELKPFLLSCCMGVATVGNFTGQGIYLQHCGFILDGTSRKVKTPKKEDKNISNQSERCIQILACVVYNDHAYPGQRITAKVEKTGGRLGQSVRCYWIVSSSLCSSVVVLKYCWWWLVGACVKGATEPNSTTNWLKQPEARGQKTRGPGDQAPGNQGPGDQRTRGPRGLGGHRVAHACVLQGRSRMRFGFAYTCVLLHMWRLAI